MSARREFVELARVEGANMALLCRRFGISRKTGYKWLGRYRGGGDAALADQSRRPHRSPARTGDELQQQVIALRRKHPAWGGRKLAACLKRRSVRLVPAASTITEILRRHNLLDAKRCDEVGPPQRFEYAHPNDLWQMDFKGHFALNGGGRCHPLTVLDDHSRYSLVLAACDNERGPTVQRHLIEAFRRYGLPRRMLMDNGSPWGSCGAMVVEPWTALSVWLMRLDIKVMHGRPMHPQTQGKEERFHQTLVAEVLRWHRFGDIAEAQQRFDPWREIYNHERPHEALGMLVPAERYRFSPREYPERLPEIQYSTTDLVRRVRRCNGHIKLHNEDFFIGKAFGNQDVALRPTRVAGLWDVYYCQHRIGQIDEGQTERRSLRAWRS